ncbi:hypothetical protein ACFLRM_06690, partial [Acidobacteriota bacterium]
PAWPTMKGGETIRFTLMGFDDQGDRLLKTQDVTATKVGELPVTFEYQGKTYRGGAIVIGDKDLDELYYFPSELTIVEGNWPTFELFAKYTDGSVESIYSYKADFYTVGRHVIERTYQGKTARAILIVKAEGDVDEIEKTISSLYFDPQEIIVELGKTGTSALMVKYEDDTTAVVKMTEVKGEKLGAFRASDSYNGMSPKDPLLYRVIEQAQDIDKILKALSGEGPEEGCNMEYMKSLADQLFVLKDEVQVANAKFLTNANKFDKEINDQAAPACTNGMLAYCYANAANMADTLKNLLDQIDEISIEVIRLYAECPDLAAQMEAQGNTMESFVSSVSGLSSYEERLASMQGRLREFGCDENEVRQNGMNVVPADQDPDFLQDGGSMTEIPGDAVDNDADGLQDENVDALVGYNITFVLYDSGSAKDDIFNLAVSRYGSLGTTPKGGLRSYGLNLPPGNYTAQVTVVGAPDDIGTFTLVILESGIQIASTSGSPPEGSVVTLNFTVTGSIE